MKDLHALTEAVSSGDRQSATTLTGAALEAGVDPQVILDAMIVAMDEIGGKFQRNEVFVPEMLIAARAMGEAMKLLEPRLVEAGIEPKYTAVIGTVQGDLHDIGKNLVAMMWKGANFRVIDLGSNVPAQKFVEAAKEHQPDVIGLSALLTTTMPAMKATVAALRAAELDGVKIMIGGAPITDTFASEIGADGYAPDAGSAVEKVRAMVCS